MVTIKQIAAELGISTTSVSNVIHGKTSEVSPSTISRVEEALKKYNYVPNINARNLALNKSGLVGVAFIDWADQRSNYLEDAFIGELVGSIERELTDRGYQMMLNFSKSFEALIDTIISWNVDGVIVFGIQTRESYDKMKEVNRPIVFIDSYLGDMKYRGASIQLDDRQGEYLIGKHLIEKGHKRIAYLSTHMNWNENERYMGLARAMTEAGLYKGTENYIQLVEDNSSIEGCADMLVEATKRFTAFACFSDYYAMMVINVLQDRGVRVPEDVSVCGFDDNIYGRMCRPRVTTIHQNPTEKGILAVKAIVEQIEEDRISNDYILLPVSLVEGGSVKDIRE